MRERKLQREREQARRAALLKLEKLRTAAATAIQAAQRRHSSCVLLSDLRTMHSGRFVARLHVFLRFPRFQRPKPGDLIMRARTGCLGCYGAQGRCLLVVVDEERRAAATIIQAVERGRAQRRYRRWRLKANAMLMKITTKVIRLRLSVALDGLVDLKIEHAIQPRVPPTGVDSFEVSLRAVGFVAIATPKRNLARDLRQNIMRDKREGSPGRSRGRASPEAMGTLPGMNTLAWSRFSKELASMVMINSYRIAFWTSLVGTRVCAVWTGRTRTQRQRAGYSW